MTTTHVDIYRIVYDGVCEVLVEAEHGSIVKVLSASPASTLVGRELDDLPPPVSVEVTLLASYDMTVTRT